MSDDTGSSTSDQNSNSSNRKSRKDSKSRSNTGLNEDKDSQPSGEPLPSERSTSP